jgi:hypothetical protein
MAPLAALGEFGRALADFSHRNGFAGTVYRQRVICRVRFSFPANRKIHLRQK